MRSSIYGTGRSSTPEATMIKRVVKSVGGSSVSAKGVAVLVSMIRHVFVEITLMTSTFKERAPKQTLTARDIQFAVRLVLGGTELAKHAIVQGMAAVQRGSTQGPMIKVSYVKRCLKSSMLYARMGRGTPIYLAAVLEYILAEVLELSLNVAREQKKTIIAPNHIRTAIQNDNELFGLFDKVIIAGAGAVSHMPLNGRDHFVSSHPSIPPPNDPSDSFSKLSIQNY
ncbi:hypothetical protein DFA_07149 [Cavenderia fasciculata]|uniref:Histone H2A n=1 Tax=Cavenderia fasciculata TaxID=261658 RepID=F4PVL9_CACFS|nr:uncharacterized protein DFA_07149 [Cavenderia fasciculata]EGG20033.1 hypothetical protein DFA_07149 [Cavenderia fasciculata]|eukprot:XP_004367016.1 hypothetical protein DFA_07149 [Cavenderia fasciculata]